MRKIHSFLPAVLAYYLNLFAPLFVLAQQGDLPDISKCWPVNLQISMNTARDELIKRTDDYNKRNNSFNSNCARQFKVGEEAALAKCEAELKALDIESAAIDKSKDSFLLVFAGYQKQYTSNDPKVVNGCNVSSGLGKNIDSAIAAEYNKAPEGVGDRVRKGFQAIQVHDWAVAKAWFQDALLRDQGNTGVKRLIDLCEYTISIKQSAVTITGNKTGYNNLTSQEKSILNTWIHRVRDAARKGVYTNATGDLPASALDKVRKYVYALSDAERDKLFFPDDFMTDLILYDMMK